VRSAAVQALARRDRPEDLVTMACQAHALPPKALDHAYSAAERMVARTYVRVPAVLQAGVRHDLARLIATVLAQQRGRLGFGDAIP
jgi:hypothetical protein